MKDESGATEDSISYGTSRTCCAGNNNSPRPSRFNVSLIFGFGRKYS